MYYVRGNQASRVEIASSGVPRPSPWELTTCIESAQAESRLLWPVWKAVCLTNLDHTNTHQTQYTGSGRYPGSRPLINKAYMGLSDIWSSCFAVSLLIPMSGHPRGESL